MRSWSHTSGTEVQVLLAGMVEEKEQKTASELTCFVVGTHIRLILSLCLTKRVLKRKDEILVLT